MASSVSSERAFSSAGITISKQCNRLDGDIIEALQFLKSIIHQDLMVRDFPTVAEEETELDYIDGQPSNQDSTPIAVVDADEDISWEGVSDDDSDDAADGGINTAIVDLSGSQF
jgi:hypothetical protein